jgi:hypothetical protein
MSWRPNQACAAFYFQISKIMQQARSGGAKETNLARSKDSAYILYVVCSSAEIE